VLRVKGDAQARADLEPRAVHVEGRWIASSTARATRSASSQLQMSASQIANSSAQAAHQRLAARARRLVLQADSQIAEERVPHLMSERIVDFLEAVEIDEHQRGTSAPLAGEGSLSHASIRRLSSRRFGNPVRES